MSVHSIVTTRYVVVCDGCSTKLDLGQIHGTVQAARHEAHYRGWKCPDSIRKRRGDLCPECQPAAIASCDKCVGLGWVYDSTSYTGSGRTCSGCQGTGKLG